MSDFEYLQNVTIGQYVPLDSFLHRLDPRTKLIAFTLILCILTFTPSFIAVLCGITLIWGGYVVGKISFRYALRGLLFPLPFLLAIALIQVLFFSRMDSPILFQWKMIIISYSSVMSGVTLLVRFMAIIMGLSLATFCISTSEMMQGLEVLMRPLKRIGLPVQDFILIVQITLRFLPFLAQAMERIAKAQASRGANWGGRGGSLLANVKRVIPLIVPLFITSLHRAENLALAMDARGYGRNLQRTTRYELTFNKNDAVTLGAAFAASGLLLIISVWSKI